MHAARTGDTKNAPNHRGVQDKCARKRVTAPSSIRTVTVGPGLLPESTACAGRGLNRRSGFSPCPEGVPSTCMDLFNGIVPQVARIRPCQFSDFCNENRLTHRPIVVQWGECGASTALINKGIFSSLGRCVSEPPPASGKPTAGRPLPLARGRPGGGSP